MASKLPTETEVPVNQVEQQKSTQSPSMQTFMKFIGLCIIVFAVSSILGASLKLATSKPAIKTKETYKLSEAKNPAIPPEVIGNPMFSDWSGRIKGKVLSIIDNKIEVAAIEEIFTNTGQRAIRDSSNPNITVIAVKEEYTRLLLDDINNEGVGENYEPPVMSLNDLAPGDIIDGNVVIEYDASTEQSDLVGSVLTVRRSL